MQLLSSLSFLLFHSLLLGALGWRRFGTSSRKYASTRSGDKHMTLHAKHTLDGQEIDGDLQPVTNFCLVKVKESLEETVRDVPLFFFFHFALFASSIRFGFISTLFEN